MNKPQITAVTQANTLADALSAIDNVKYCTAQQLAQMIEETNGAFFNVTFIKRTTDEVRTMTCRTGVWKYTNGVGLKYDRKDHALIGVWVANEGKAGADAYRSVSIDGLVSAKIAGQTYVVGDAA